MRKLLLLCALSAASSFAGCTKYVLNPFTGLMDCSLDSSAGTVTSIGLAGTANQITVTGASPITTSGSWTLSFPNVAQMPGTLAVNGATIGSNALAVTGSSLLPSIISASVQPASDSTTAFRIFKADGITAVLTVDTTNSITNIANRAAVGQATIGGNSLLTSTVNGTLELQNNTATAGVFLDFSTDATAKFRNRANNTDAAITAAGGTFSGPINKVTITAPATGSTLTILDGKTVTHNNTTTFGGVDGKTVAFNNSLTFAGTDSTTMTFPSTSATIARTDAAQTFTGPQTIASIVGNTAIQSTGASADALLTVSASTGGAATVAPASNVLLHLVSSNSQGNSIEIDSFAATPINIFRRSDGTIASKTALGQFALLGETAFIGWDGSVYGQAAQFDCYANQAWTNSAHGTACEIYTNSNGSTTSTLAATFGADQSLTVMGFISGTTYKTASNCASGASPALCSSASAGHVAIPTGVNPTLQVNSSAVTANSEIVLTSDDTVGSLLSVTCNSTLTTIAGGWVVTARSAGSSFTITYNGTITTNPLCLGYIINN